LNGSNVVFVAVKVKKFAGTAVRRTILSPKWIIDVGDATAVVGVRFCTT
jgi:hypothetical protein